MPKHKKNVFTAIQKKYKVEFPVCIIEILRLCGFDTEFAVKNITEQSIHEIETFLTVNYNLLDSVVLPAYYKKKEFSFLPGHKICLLQVAETMKTFGTEKEATTVVNEEEELPTDHAVHLQNFEKKLIDKLLKYSKNNNLWLNAENFTVKSLRNMSMTFSQGNPVGKCLVICPSCEREVSVLLKKYWYTANFEKHMKEHEAFNNTAIPDNDTNNTDDTNGNQESNAANDNDLNKENAKDSGNSQVNAGASGSTNILKEFNNQNNSEIDSHINACFREVLENCENEFIL